VGTFPEAGAALLTLPEQRRSRRQSPHSLVVETAPHDGSESGRTSIGLPPNQRRSGGLDSSHSAAGGMTELEKQSHGDRPPDQPHKGATTPTSRYNTQDRDVEANLPQGPSMLGQKYGMGKDDQPSHPPRHTRSQASLPKAYSIKSERTESRAGPEGGMDDAASVAEELVWGPSHPCFPHLNSHVPLDSPEYVDTRIIRVKRDWMVRGDLAPTYSNLYPEILDPLLPEHQFRNVIQQVNQTLVMTFDPYSRRNWIDGVLGVVTGWFWEDLGFGGVKKRLRDLEQWLADWNRDVGCAEGVKIIPLRRTGYMSLDIQIPDPQVRIVNDDPGQDEEAQQQSVKGSLKEPVKEAGDGPAAKS
jgi:Golgin subfamily A member 7/ERF4 family